MVRLRVRARISGHFRRAIAVAGKARRRSQPAWFPRRCNAASGGEGRREWSVILARTLGAVLLAVAVVTLPTPALASQDPGDLLVGHWVKVKGRLDEKGEFVASAVEILPPDDDEALTGTVSLAKSSTRFLLLGQEIHASARTELRNVQLGDLGGARIKVEGDYRGPRNFSADVISRRGPGRDAIEGRIDSITKVLGGWDLIIMHFTVHVATEVEVALDTPLQEIELAPVRIFSGPLERRQVISKDEKVRLSRRIGKDFYYGGQLEYDFEHRNNFDLNDDRDRNRSDNEVNLRAEVLWEPSDDFFFLLGGRMRYIWRDEEGAPNSERGDAVLSEGYGFWRDLWGTDWSLQVGRQDFEERREWLYDQNMDAVRLIRSAPDWRLELSASTTLSDGSPRDRDSTNLIAYLSNNDVRRHAATYVVSRYEGSDDLGVHVGARAYGPWLPGNRSWVETSALLGKSGGRDLQGLGLDLGTTWWPGGEWIPGFGLTAGYAYGSGDDDPTDGTDRAYRQTGLGDNNDKFGGVTSFRYYGELVEPELSNIGIATLGAGFRLASRTSIDLVFHKYDQAVAAASLLNTNLRAKPDGLHRDLGWELDLVLGSRESSSWQIELVLGYFHPGDAFPGADDAWLGAFQLRYRL